MLANNLPHGKMTPWKFLSNEKSRSFGLNFSLVLKTVALLGFGEFCNVNASAGLSASIVRLG
jgi:hypothetical protein